MDRHFLILYSSRLQLNKHLNYNKSIQAFKFENTNIIKVLISRFVVNSSKYFIGMTLIATCKINNTMYVLIYGFSTH